MAGILACSIIATMAGCKRDSGMYAELEMTAGAHTERALAIGSMAVYARLSAALLKEKLCRVTDNGDPVGEISDLEERIAEAREAACVIDAATYVVGVRLDGLEARSCRQTAPERFADAGGWAEHVAGMADRFDGGKLAAMAELLRSDAVTVSAASPPDGLLVSGGYAVNGADAVLMMSGEDLRIVLAEDGRCIVPCWADADELTVAMVRFAGKWADDGYGGYAGGMRFLAGTPGDMARSSVLGVKWSPKVLAAKEKARLGYASVDGNAAGMLAELGFDRKDARRALAPSGDGNSALRPFSRLSDEELDALLDSVSLSGKNWKQTFSYDYDMFKRLMAGYGYLTENDTIFGYDPFEPPDDLSQIANNRME